MKGFHRKRVYVARGFIFFTAIFFCTMGPGCNPVSRHRALTFFFDGVTPLESPEQEESVETSDVAVPIKPAAPVEMVQHPPYADKMCDSCHKISNTSTGVPMGFSLLEKRDKLCQMCHDDKSPESLAETYAWVHGPVQYGECLTCHHPHESANPYMLNEKPVSQLCFRCHDRERLLHTEMHSEIGETDCTECHNPHGSQARYLLVIEGTREAGSGKQATGPSSDMRNDDPRYNHKVVFSPLF